MTSAMTLSFGVSPDYKGALKMETYVRKIKTSKSLGRVISSYNKRYLVLDLKRMMFYYLADRNSAFGSGSDIPLDSITRMYIDTDATTYMKEDQSWLHGMTILTTKKAFRFKFDSRQSLDNWLVAFNNIINLQTKIPVYSWPAPGTLPDEPEPNYFTSYKAENSKAPETPVKQENNAEEALTAKRRDSSAKRQPIFSPSESDKVMNNFDSQEKQHQPVIKAVKKKTSNPSSQNSVASGTSGSSEEVPEKGEIASIGKIKTPERTKKTEEEKPAKEEIKNKEANLKEVDQNEDRQQQQQEQVDSAQHKAVKAITKLPVDDLKVSNDVELDGNNTPKVDSHRSGGGMTPGNSFRHVRNGSMSRRNMATGGISLLDDIKKSSLDSSKKNSWDEENSEDKKMTVGRRPSNLLNGNKSALSRLSLRKDDESAVKAAVGNLWKDNFGVAREKEIEQEQGQEQVREEPVKQAKNDHWDDWDKDFDTEDNKPVKSSSKQPSNEQVYNNKSTFSDFKAKNDVFNAPTSESKKSLDAKTEEFHTEKKPVHNDWDDEW